jgi:hypothetical protein
MSHNEMVRPASAPVAIEAGKGRQRQGKRHVSKGRHFVIEGE